MKHEVAAPEGTNTVLLTTKFHIHPVRKNLVHRRSLVDRLQAGLNRKLSLVSAPAGFGKSTLIGEWVDRVRTEPGDVERPTIRVAWLSLDENDTDYLRFFTYFIGALQTIDWEMGRTRLSEPERSGCCTCRPHRRRSSS